MGARDMRFVHVREPRRITFILGPRGKAIFGADMLKSACLRHPRLSRPGTRLSDQDVFDARHCGEHPGRTVNSVAAFSP